MVDFGSIESIEEILMIGLGVLRIDTFAKRLLLILPIIPRVVLTPLLQACHGERNTLKATAEPNPTSLEPQQDCIMP